MVVSAFPCLPSSLPLILVESDGIDDVGMDWRGEKSKRNGWWWGNDVEWESKKRVEQGDVERERMGGRGERER